MRPNSVAKQQPPLLRHDQQLAVGVVEEAAAHRPVRGVDVDRAAGAAGGIAVARHRHQAVDEIDRFGGARQRQRVPAQLVGRRRHAAERTDDPRLVDQAKRLVHRRRPDPVRPRPPVGAPRRRECRARQLLGVQAVRRALRRVAADRQRAGQRLGGELVGEAGHVGEAVDVGRRDRRGGPGRGSGVGGGRHAVLPRGQRAGGATSSRAAAIACARTSASPM